MPTSEIRRTLCVKLSRNLLRTSVRWESDMLPYRVSTGMPKALRTYTCRPLIIRGDRETINALE
jgi:hypothetical protein